MSEQQQSNNNSNDELIDQDIKIVLDDLKALLSTTSLFSKKKAVEKFNNSFINNVSKFDNNDIFMNHLFEPLNNLTLDSLEKCRTISLELLLLSSNNLKSFPTCINRLLFTLETISKTEQVEELQILNIKLLDKIIEIGSVESISTITDRIVNIFKNTLSKNIPELKESTLKSISKLSEKVPNRIKYYSSELISKLIECLGDRHQRVRSESLYALSSLVNSGSIKIIDTLEDHLVLLANDQSSLVKITCCKCIQSWITNIGQPIRQYYHFLLFNLISLSTSDILPIKQEAINALNSLNKSSSGDSEIDISDIDMDQRKELINDFRNIKSLVNSNNSHLKYIKNTFGNVDIDDQIGLIIFQHSQAIMKYYYRTIHDHQLNSVVREYKLSFLIALICYLGKSNAIRYIDAIMQILIVYQIDTSVDSITTKYKELVILLGHLIPLSIMLPRVTELVKQQLQDQNDLSIIKSLLLILNLYFIGFKSSSSSALQEKKKEFENNQQEKQEFKNLLSLLLSLQSKGLFVLDDGSCLLSAIFIDSIFTKENIHTDTLLKLLNNSNNNLLNENISKSIGFLSWNDIKK
ncbi:hypothetical protein CYY_009994 [Polysphondylium violaceum]|uniref:Dynein axonemal assembly factor 5 TPR repeats domain-containing protein n=1 Tax=Polysphondylium violaceum TaxID=133409 RepID=A0A8J4PSK6_9MYCE|nr:hypothetical protein CYY_009994 [Polysphondylium violaceum]